MKASRLVSTLLLLQLRQKVTARQLAEHHEVSVRTAYRDIEALQHAGVPIYSEVGPQGGFRLVEGWETRLTGLTGLEPEALFLTALPGPAADLGLSPPAAAAALKIQTSLSSELRKRVSWIEERFHLDPRSWFLGADPAHHLATVAEAVRRQERLVIRYRGWRGEGTSEVDPLGVVLKGGYWYLVANTAGGTRTYRVARILSLVRGMGTFERPVGFDLVAFWARSVEQYETCLRDSNARLRLSPRGRMRLGIVFGDHVERMAALKSCAADAAGWIEVIVPVDSDVASAADQIMGLGADAEVLEPVELRDAIAIAACTISRMYGVSTSAA